MTPFWTFTDRVPRSRQEAMFALAEFADVVAILAASAVSHFEIERRRSGDGHRRAFFKFDVQGQTYDAFFNSPVGLRAQYARGVETGEKANRLLLDALSRPVVCALCASSTAKRARRVPN
jgi:hypothetical protein